MVTINYHGKRIKLDEEMQRYLQYALKEPMRWHAIGAGKKSQDAIKRLVQIGLVETQPGTNKYKINPSF
jgi:hypothetical protein